MAELKVIPLAELRLDGGTQMRQEVSQKYQDELSALFNEDNPIWPKDLDAGDACFDGKNYWVFDGHHRYGAAADAGCVNVPVRIHAGSLETAKWLACGANKKHGLRRKPGDVANAIKMAYILRPNSTTREIALHVGTNHQYVSECNPNSPSKLKKSTQQGGNGGLPPKNTSGVSNSANNSHADKVPDWASEEEDRDGDTDYSEAQGSEPIQTESAGSREGDSGSGGDSADVPPDGPPAAAPLDHGLDDAGLPIPASAAASFQAKDIYERIGFYIDELAHALNELGHHPGGLLLRSHHLKLFQRGDKESFYSRDLENLRVEIERWMPFAGTCPCCRGEPQRDCAICHGAPFVTKHDWNKSPEKLRQSLFAQTECEAA